MRMKTSEQRSYLAPEIEVNDVMVEQGIAASQLGGIDYNPTNPGESPSLPSEDTGW